MNRQQLARRREFDLRVLTDMRCATFDFEAYRTGADLAAHRSPVTDVKNGAAAVKYRWIFRIKTHISKHEFAPVTEISVDTDVKDYPREPPGTAILSSHVPWSPHFLRGAPVCVGRELWDARRGKITLGELAINIAHMLNWDEPGRGPGYQGYNSAAVKYHQNHYGGRPIDPGLVYPVLPAWLAGEQAPAPAFQIVGNPGPDPGFRVR